LKPGYRIKESKQGDIHASKVRERGKRETGKQWTGYPSCWFSYLRHYNVKVGIYSIYKLVHYVAINDYMRIHIFRILHIISLITNI